MPSQVEYKTEKMEFITIHIKEKKTVIVKNKQKNNLQQMPLMENLHYFVA